MPKWKLTRTDGVTVLMSVVPLHLLQHMHITVNLAEHPVKVKVLSIHRLVEYFPVVSLPCLYLVLVCSMANTSLVS